MDNLNSQSTSTWCEDDDMYKSDDLAVNNLSKTDKQSARERSAEVLQDANNNDKSEVEEELNGSDDDDDDEGTCTYWQVKAKEGHKVSVSFKLLVSVA